MLLLSLSAAAGVSWNHRGGGACICAPRRAAAQRGMEPSNLPTTTLAPAGCMAARPTNPPTVEPVPANVRTRAPSGLAGPGGPGLLRVSLPLEVKNLMLVHVAVVLGERFGEDVRAVV